MVIPREVRHRRFAANCGIGCLTGLVGALAGFGSLQLARAARRTCGPGIAELGPDPTSWYFWELPLIMGAGALVAMTAYALVGARARTGVAVLVTVAALILLTWAHFAWLGTPAGAGTADKVVCPASMIPPWWPSRLPA